MNYHGTYRTVRYAACITHFGRRANGASNQTYLDGFFPRMIALLKPESINEVKATMSQFGQGFTKSQFAVNLFYGASRRDTLRC